MNINIKTVTLIFVLVNVASAGTIPMPDGIIYGKLNNHGQPVSPTQKIAVFARIDGMDAPVAVYHMGDLPAAGSAYVLHVPHRLEEDGKTLTSDSPSPGGLASIYFVQQSGGEILVGKIPVPEMGKASLLDIDIATGQRVAGDTVNSPGLGGLCGAIGMINLSWIGMGLITLRRISIYSKRRNI